MVFLVPVLAAVLAAAPWQDSVTGSALTKLDVEARPAFSTSGALVGSYVSECHYALATFAAAPAPAVTLKEELWSDPVVSGDGYAALLYSARCGGKTLDLAHLGADGSVGARVRLPVSGYPYPAVIAPGPRGTVAVGWVENTQATHRQRLRVGVYGTDRWVRRPVTLATHRYSTDGAEIGIDELALAVDARGKVIVAFADERSVRAAVLGERPVQLGPSLGVVNLALAVSPKGRAAVAWGTHDGGEEVNEKARVYAALREPGRPFPRARHLETQPRLDRTPYAEEPDGDPHVAVAADGTALVSWDSLIGTRRQRRPLRVVRARPGHAFGAYRTLTGNANPGTVALAADGQGLVTWTHDGGIYARLSTRAGAFGPPQQVGEDGFPYASFGPDGRPRVQWLSDDAKLHTATR